MKTFWANTKRDTGYKLLPEQELTVYALRPGSLRIEASRPKGLKEGEEWIANPFNLLISNGKEQLELARESKLYYHYKAAPKLDEVESRNGLHIKISPDILFTNSPLRDFKYEGEAEKEGKAVSIYFTELPYRNGKVKYVLWLDRKTKLPMRLAIFMPNKSGNVIESERAEFYNWKLNPKLSPSLFDPTPPPDAKPAPPLGVIQKPK